MRSIAPYPMPVSPAGIVLRLRSSERCYTIYMPPNIDKETFDEMFRLTRDNNRMLHAMRRSAFLGSVLKFVFYAAIIGFSVWSYLQFVAPMLDQTLKMMQQVQGTGAQAQAQLSGFQDTLKKLQDMVPSLPTGQ